MDLATQRSCKTPVFSRWGAVVIIGLIVTACKREEIRVYTVPKERNVEMASTTENDRAGGVPHIHYQMPPGWVEEQPGGIRVARFSVPSKQGPQVDVSVIPLPGITASKADVVNLWREQIRLGAIKEDELAGMIERVKIGSESAEMFDMVSTENIIEEKHKARILVAMLSQGRTTWFFKMTGEDESVKAQKSAFMQFLNSVEFDSSDHGEGPPRFTSTNVKEVPGSRREAPLGGGGRPGWEVPSGWQEVPPPQMLLARFVMPDKEEPKAEVTVSVFPGDAGGLLPNINRWRRQIKLDPVQSDSLQEMTTALDVLGGKAILVDMSGENPTNGQPTRIIAAILPKGERTWFYKLMGNEQVAEREKAAFIKFVQTATHPNG